MFKTCFKAYCILSLFLYVFIFSVPAYAAANSTTVLENSVGNGLNKWATGNIDTMVAGNHLHANKADPANSTVGMFSESTEPVDIFSDPTLDAGYVRTVGTFKWLFDVGILVLGFFAILNARNPVAAVKVTRFVFGYATTITFKDMIDFAVKNGLWFVLGVSAFVGLLQVSNHVLAGTNTGVLSQITASSVNLAEYGVLGATSELVRYYFGIRKIMILLTARLWLLLGVVVAFKPTRPIGIMYIMYSALNIIVQPVTVGILSFVCGLALNGSLKGITGVVTLGSMGLIVCLILLFVSFSPIIIEIFKRGTVIKIFNFARGFAL